MRIKMIAVTILGAALSFAAAAQELTPEEQAYLAALEAELPGTLMNNPLDPGFNTFGEDVRTRVVEVPELPGGFAYQAKVRRAKPRPWDISIATNVTGDVRQGDSVAVAFWARAKDPDRDTGAGHIQVRLQQNASPYAGVVEQVVDIGPDWQLYEIKGVSAHSFSGSQMSLAFNIGDYKQTIEIGQYFVLNLGPATPA